MRFLFAFFFAFFLVFLSAEEDPSFVNSENDTLALVEGVVNAYNGSFVQIDRDIEIQGSDPFELLRYYDGAHDLGFSPFGYKVGLSLPLELKFYPMLHEGNVRIEQRTESFLYFDVYQYKSNRYKGKISPRLLKSGYTNCCEALLNGGADLSAMAVYGKGKEFTLDLGNGVKRYYKYDHKDSNDVRYYRLIKEDLQNGNCRHYSYFSSKNYKPKRIWTTNKDGTLTLNWLEFEFYDKGYSARASNGQKVNYFLELKRGKAETSSRFPGLRSRYRAEVLMGLSGDHLLNTQYEPLYKTRYSETIYSNKAIKRPDGRSLSIALNKDERVQKLFLAGIDTPLYTFDYHSHHTNVKDARGVLKKYYFDKRRLVKLIEPDKIQIYKWSKYGKLQSHILEANGKQISRKEYSYDDQGNILESKLIGSITGKDCLDVQSVRYTYSKDGRNNILVENHNDQKKILFSYLPNTNLVTSSLTQVGDKIVERVFKRYDENAILIEEITDDGSASAVGDLTDVSYRLITEISPQLNPDLPGLTQPAVVSEYYLDLKTGMRNLLKRVEKSYTKGDLLQEERVFGSDGNFCYKQTYDYNDKRQLIKTSDAAGQITLYAYDESGNKTEEEVIGSGKKTRFVYDLANRLIQEIEMHDDGLCLTTTHAYDAMSHKVSTTDHFGKTTHYAYDAAGRITSETDPLNQTEYKAYDALGNIVALTDKEGFTTSTVYNILGKPLEITHPDGTEQSFAYNILGHLIHEKKRDGTTIEYDVDYLGREKAIRYFDKDGACLKQIFKTYKGPHLISETDAMGHEMTYSYDDAGRKVSQTQGGITTEYVYDTLGRQSQIITPDAVSVKVYDALDRIIEERQEDIEGNLYKKTEYGFDINGNIISEKTFQDENSSSLKQTEYNSRNEPVSITDALGNQTTIKYLYSDHLEKHIQDPLLRKEIQVFDSINRLILVQKLASDGGLLSQKSLIYDGRDHVVQEVQKNILNGSEINEHKIERAFDAMGQKTKESEQDEKTTHYNYLQGRLHQIIKPDGVILTHVYDALGRLKSLTSSDETINYLYSYDLNDNLLKAEDLVQHTTTERSYDALNRLISEKQATGFTISYAYDSLNRLKEVAFGPDKIVYEYNPLAVISAARYKNNDLLYSFSQEVNGQGKPTKQSLPYVDIEYTWDLLGRCQKIESTSFCQNFDYDSIGNLISTDVVDPIGSYTSNFCYDELNQLTKETGLFENHYLFDSLNNRREKNQEINSLNQLLSEDENSYGYDANGNRSLKNDTVYTYDALNRLTQVKTAQIQVQYQYDPFGRQIRAITPDETKSYIYQFDKEIGSQSEKSRKFRAIYGQHASFAIEIDDQLFTPIRNHRGDICILLNPETTATYRYSAFGSFCHNGTIRSPWLFSGQRYDQNINCYQFLKRQYDPETGRWLTADPLGFADGPNLYAYVHNNPLTFVDPYGLFGERIYDNTKGFLKSAGRGVADESSWGLTSYAFEEYQTATFASKAGYYTGYAASFAVGCFYGAPVIKGLFKGGKVAINGFRLLRSANTAAKASKGALATKSITKLTQDSKPILQRVAISTEKTGLVKTAKKLDLDALSKAGQVPDRAGLTRAGRALDKHGNRAGSVFPKANGNSVSKNAQGQYHLDDILTDPRGSIQSNRLGGFDFIKSNGAGVRYYKDGSLRGFLEPN